MVLSIFRSHSGNLKNATSLKDIATGEIIDLTNKGNVVRFIAKDVPAMGYKSYMPVEGKADCKFRSPAYKG